MSKENTSIIRVGLLFGGRSGEHDVSVASACSVLDAVDKERYEITPIRIGHDGRWRALPKLSEIQDLEQLKSLSGWQCCLIPGDSEGILLSIDESAPARKVKLDVIFPLLHGVMGEDGTVQGLLSLSDVAYVGSEVLGSALGMDKVLMKQIFEHAGLRCVPSCWFRRSTWQEDTETVTDEIEEHIGYPCFVKPANTGSSVGVQKVHGAEELQAAVELAARLDMKIIVEKALNVRELECGILGNGNLEVTPVGEVTSAHEFYDYEAKYLTEGGSINIPADIDDDMAEQISSWAIKAFEAIDACGMARVDFFVEKDTGELYINEVNTIPGFTPRSMFPMLWESAGVSYSGLFDKLIELALQRQEEKRKTQGYEEINVQ